MDSEKHARAQICQFFVEFDSFAPSTTRCKSRNIPIFCGQQQQQRQRQRQRTTTTDGQTDFFTSCACAGQKRMLATTRAVAEWLGIWCMERRVPEPSLVESCLRPSLESFFFLAGEWYRIRVRDGTVRTKFPVPVL